jgi:prepilin-type processing-associated H-X9-DG protein
MPVGSGTISDGSGSSRFQDIRDGTSMTIAVVEIFPTDIYWNEPRDLPLDRMSLRLNDPSKPSISSPHTDGAIAVFADGHTQTLSNAIDPKVLKALLTIRGGESIEQEY